jgi:hypothetical protein
VITLAKNVQNGRPILSSRNEARQLFHRDLHSPPSQTNLISSWCSQARSAGRQTKFRAQRYRYAGSIPRRPGQDENQYFSGLGLGNRYIKPCPLGKQTTQRLIDKQCLALLQKWTHYSCTFGLEQVV